MPASPNAAAGGGPKDVRHRRLEKQVVSTNFSVQARRNNARLFQENKQRKEHLMPLSAGDVAARMQLYRQPCDAVLDVGATARRQEWRTYLLEHTATGKKRNKRDPQVSVRLPSTELHTGNEGDVTTASAPPSARLLLSPQEAATPRVSNSTTPVLGELSSSTVPGPSSISPFSAPFTKGLPCIPAGSGRMFSSPQRHAPSSDALPPRTAAMEEWLDKGCPVGSFKDLLAQELYLPERVEKVFYRAKYARKGTYTTAKLAALVRGSAYGGGYYDVGLDDDDDEDGEKQWMLASSLSESQGSHQDGEGGNVSAGGSSLPRSKSQGSSSKGSEPLRHPNKSSERARSGSRSPGKAGGAVKGSGTALPGSPRSSGLERGTASPRGLSPAHSGASQPKGSGSNAKKDL